MPNQTLCHLTLETSDSVTVLAYVTFGVVMERVNTLHQRVDLDFERVSFRHVIQIKSEIKGSVRHTELQRFFINVPYEYLLCE